MKKKAEEVAEIMGGKFQDYINIILNMPCKSSVLEIIENLMAEIENKDKVCSERKPVIHNEEVVVVPVEKKSDIKEEPKKVLKKKFSNAIKKKAH